MEEPLLTLVPIFNEKTGYEVKEYEHWLDVAEKYVAESLKTALDIGDDFDKRFAKVTRTDIRKKSEQVKQARLAANNGVLGTFNMQLKAIEKVLNDADKQIKAKLDEYEKANEPKEEEKPSEPLSCVLTICHLDHKVLEKIKEYALSLGATIKGE